MGSLISKRKVADGADGSAPKTAKRGIFSTFGRRSSSAVRPEGGGGDEGDAASYGSRGSRDSVGSGKPGTEDDGSTLGSVPGLFGHALEAAAAVAPAKKPPKPIDPEKLEACHAAFFEWFGLARPYDLSAAQHAKLRDDATFAATLEMVSYLLACSHSAVRLLHTTSELLTRALVPIVPQMILFARVAAAAVRANTGGAGGLGGGRGLRRARRRRGPDARAGRQGRRVSQRVPLAGVLGRVGAGGAGAGCGAAGHERRVPGRRAADVPATAARGAGRRRGRGCRGGGGGHSARQARQDENGKQNKAKNIKREERWTSRCCSEPLTCSRP